MKYHRYLRDIEFDLEDDQTRCLRSATYLDELEAPLGVLRVTQIFENPRFVIDGADVVDIIQGKLSYCWLLSILSTMSTSKGLTEKYALRHFLHHFWHACRVSISYILLKCNEEVGFVFFCAST